MKSFESNSGMKFSNPLACALDNQETLHNFRTLWTFLCEFDPDALEEWRVKRNFVGIAARDIFQTLVTIQKLKR